MSDIGSRHAFTTIEAALRDPGRWCARITSFPAGTRQLEPMERWQTRAVMAALAKLSSDRLQRAVCVPRTDGEARS